MEPTTSEPGSLVEQIKVIKKDGASAKAPTAPIASANSQAVEQAVWWKRRTSWAVVVIGAGTTYAAYRVMHKTKVVVVKPTAPAVAPVAPPQPTTKASPTTGATQDPAAADRAVTAVVIENHTDARPQSGLAQADVVYEALAEGGITRFLAFFHDQRPATLGPVRSVRTYFVDWALEYQAPVAHAGGNADALDLIGPTGMKDMNGLSNAAGAFYRTKDRYAPHNLYTSSDLLDAQMAALGFNKPTNFYVNPRVPDAPGGTHPTININYSYNGYQVQYQYNKATNDYGRVLAGAPHIDRNTGQQIRVKNIVVEYMTTNYGTTRIGEQTVIMGTVGSGQAIVFRDGEAYPGTWSKASRNDRTHLIGTDGKDIPLDVGNTWYSIVPVGKTVGY
jgi:hypothetical protein